MQIDHQGADWTMGTSKLERAMNSPRQIRVLRDGPRLIDQLGDRDAAHWALCATGQAIAFEDIPVPEALLNIDLVEPLGGNLLTLILRPSLKQMDDDHALELAEFRHYMLEKLLHSAKLSENVLYHALKARDVFGLNAIDYAPEISVLGGQTLEQIVKENWQLGDKCRRIIRSLAREEMANSDLFLDLVSARRSLGVELYQGISSHDPMDLRRILLTHFDLLNKHCRQTQGKNPAFFAIK